MFELKKLSREAIDVALGKAERYRLLNEPFEAESICRDVLVTDPGNQRAVIMLLLTLTDQLGIELGATEAQAREVLPRITDPYQQHYYDGIICEREGKRLLKRDAPGSGPVVYDWLRRAMACYAQAEPLRPEGDESAVLRWNTCARLIMHHDQVRPEESTATADLPLE